VRWQVFAEVTSQRVRPGLAGGAGRVGDRKLRRRPGIDEHGDRPVDAGMSLQGGLDLAELDPVSPELDLVVLTAEELDVPVGPIAPGRRFGNTARRCE
jgi:hypothetical protein